MGQYLVDRQYPLGRNAEPFGGGEALGRKPVLHPCKSPAVKEEKLYYRKPEQNPNVR